MLTRWYASKGPWDPLGHITSASLSSMFMAKAWQCVTLFIKFHFPQYRQADLVRATSVATFSPCVAHWNAMSLTERARWWASLKSVPGNVGHFRCLTPRWKRHSLQNGAHATVIMLRKTSSQLPPIKAFLETPSQRPQENTVAPKARWEMSRFHRIIFITMGKVCAHKWQNEHKTFFQQRVWCWCDAAATRELLVFSICILLWLGPLLFWFFSVWTVCNCYMNALRELLAETLSSLWGCNIRMVKNAAAPVAGPATKKRVLQECALKYAHTLSGYKCLYCFQIYT